MTMIFTISLIAFIYYWWKKRVVKKVAGENFETHPDYLKVSNSKRIAGFICAGAFLLAVIFAPDKSQTTIQTSNQTEVKQSEPQQISNPTTPQLPEQTPQLPEQISAYPGLGSTLKAWESIHQRNTQYQMSNIYDGERFVLTIFNDRIYVISHQADVAKDQFSSELIALMCPSDMKILDKKSHSDQFHRIERFFCESESLKKVVPESNGNFKVEIHFDLKTNKFLHSTISVTQ